MKQVVIENPIINSPFGEPTRHFRFTNEGITDEIVSERRTSSYFVPIARPRKKNQKQLEFETEWTQDRIEENKLVNQIRARVNLWREGGCVGLTPTTSRLPTRVRALESRSACEINFPRLFGYRYDLGDEHLTATITAESHLVLSTADIPSKTENAPIVGESSIHTLADLKRRRPNEVAFLLAKLTLEKYFRQDGEIRADRPKEHKFDGEVKSWLFPQLFGIAKRWLAESHPFRWHRA